MKAPCSDQCAVDIELNVAQPRGQDPARGAAGNAGEELVSLGHDPPTLVKFYARQPPWRDIDERGDAFSRIDATFLKIYEDGQIVSVPSASTRTGGATCWPCAFFSSEAETLWTDFLRDSPCAGCAA
jgi:hypothetical protein